MVSKCDQSQQIIKYPTGVILFESVDFFVIFNLFDT